MTNFGFNLKNNRLEQGMTQKALAKILGVSQATVALIETGGRCPGHSLYLKIHEVFGMRFPEAVLLKNIVVKKVKRLPLGRLKELNLLVDMWSKYDNEEISTNHPG